MSNRIADVVDAIVAGVRQALKENKVTAEEYRQGVEYIMKTTEAQELPLLLDLYFDIAICENENSQFKGTRTDLQGPYYVADAPFVNGEIKTMPEFDGKPMIVQGQVTDVDGNPVPDAVIDIWQSTPDGKYSGFHDNIPHDYYRGKVRSDSEGRYSVVSTVPVPYQIKGDGPTGALLEMMERHNWRPAHIHFKAQKEGFHPVTMQAYFAEGDYVNDDCCDGLCNQGHNVIPEKYENGARVMDVDIVLDNQAA